MLAAARRLFVDLQDSRQPLQKTNDNETVQTVNTDTTTDESKNDVKPSDDGFTCGDDDPQNFGSSLGIANDQSETSSPKNSKILSPTNIAERDDETVETVETVTEESQKKDIDDERQRAFLEFKKTPGGIEIEEIWNETKNVQKEKRTELKITLDILKEKKGKIDEIKAILGNFEEANQGADDSDLSSVLNDERTQCVTDLKMFKKEYRLLFEKQKQLRTDLLHIEHTMTSCKSRLLETFEDWVGSASSQSDDERMDLGDKFESLEVERLENMGPGAKAYYAALKNSKGGTRRPCRRR
eukprot:GHVL01039330.1.p1 GENE.GHVL01039330.1~~GHVL01039330.1.p1  ORF type:complete len:298 (-),score=101.63 GHVL01039330.1:1353-2246(-)